MNTLNYKVLLTKTAIVIFFRAIGIYLLLTFPAMMALPMMYIISAGYALSFGWIAAALFLLLLFLLQKLKCRIPLKRAFVYSAVLIAVAIAFQAMELAGAQQHVWQSGGFLLFPAAAVIAGWISVFFSKRAIDHLMAGKENFSAV